jgi:hypothetical protein
MMLKSRDILLRAGSPYVLVVGKECRDVRSLAGRGKAAVAVSRPEQLFRQR